MLLVWHTAVDNTQEENLPPLECFRGHQIIHQIIHQVIVYPNKGMREGETPAQGRLSGVFENNSSSGSFDRFYHRSAFSCALPVVEKIGIEKVVRP